MSQQLGNEVERQGKQVNYMIHYYPVVIFLSSNRPALQRFLFHMRQEDGSFIMHDDGEVDIRGAYCAMVCAVLTNTFSEELFSQTANWISSCQTYEGGFSAG
jgi:prenyltransferase beta subunit